jgi:acyl-CoA synthetase (AMP-forming)/AMP-acid ligase II
MAQSADDQQGKATTLVDRLQRHAAAYPDGRAYTGLSDRGAEEGFLTYGALAARAAAVSTRISRAADPGDRALLLCPNGLDFLVGFLGCLVAGVIAVPMMLPRRQSGRDASTGIVADCAPRLVLAPANLIGGARGDLVGRIAAPGLTWLPVDAAAGAPAEAGPLPALDPDRTAFLQYTSGSTSSPKGVMVSHANLMANLEMIRIAFGNTRRSTYVSWVPLYHDMGLIVNALESLYLGAHCVLMAPVAFMQRPAVWLRAISDYRAEVAGGPNFAYDLCVDRCRPEQLQGIDLSRWRLAFNGAEPVRIDSIRRFIDTFAPYGFAANAMYPAYGMAEGTVLLSARRRGDGPAVREASRQGLLRHRAMPPADLHDTHTVVACGRALPGGRLAIVDPATRQRRAPGHIGEIWAAGPNIAQGYWQNPEASEAAFGARIVGEKAEGAWLRTGDLGFLDEAGELFITGRLKDVLIIRGANHYPQDIEETVQACHPALRRHAGAAFTIAEGGAAEKLVIVQEVERTYRNRIVPEELIRQIRAAIVSEHEIVPHDISLLRPGALPKTTSGKIQRAHSRDLWLGGNLEQL